MTNRIAQHYAQPTEPAPPIHVYIDKRVPVEPRKGFIEVKPGMFVYRAIDGYVGHGARCKYRQCNCEPERAANMLAVVLLAAGLTLVVWVIGRVLG